MAEQSAHRTSRTHGKWLRLYPLDIRVLYGDEMVATFEDRLEVRRRRGRLALVSFAIGELVWLVCDAADERLNQKLSSHPSFRGRCLPNPGVVRPPGVGKKEWFFATPPPSHIDERKDAEARREELTASGSRVL
jgi:hypothetical protein